MATREIITYDCDRCRAEGECETHTLSIDGKTVEVDGCPGCWEKFMKAARPWLDGGRRVPKTARARRRRTAATRP